MATQMSDAAKRLRRRNAVLALAAVFILALPAFCLLKWAFGLAWGVVLLSAWALTLAGELGLLIGCSFAARAAGLILLDCHPRSRRSTILFWLLDTLAATLAIRAGAFAVIAWILGDADQATDLGLWCMVLAFIALAGHPACSLQLRENGIWSTGSLLQWNRMKSYRWDGQDGLTLMIEYASRFPLARPTCLCRPSGVQGEV